MSFRVMARTVLQLGAELISSDGIAFYELIKNAFDAGSPRAEIDVVIRIPHDAYLAQARALLEERRLVGAEPGPDRALSDRRLAFARYIDAAAPDAASLNKLLLQAKTWDQLLDVWDEANYIDFGDCGSGMTRKDLQENFLTIGTRSRLAQQEQQPRDSLSRRPVLGEKGLGRLSTMRLGCRLRVQTSTKGEPNWNLLEINWRFFSHNSNALVEDIAIKPGTGRPKEDPDASGTRIRVYGLASRWSEEALREIASSEFSLLTDPFLPRSRYPISLRFNDHPVPIPAFDKILFEQAHAVVQADYSISKDEPVLTGRIEYVLRSRQKTFALNLQDLFSITGYSLSTLCSLGPFSVKFYWFNRGALEAVDGIGTKRMVQQLVNRWSGGLMVFRDGFRVNPYGSPDDDWLDLDRKALASAGFKVNRKQIIGKVDISRQKNPVLTDQTNREGLRDCDEKRALVRLLKHILEAQFRTFLNEVDDELKARLPVTFDDLTDRIEAESIQMRQGVRALLQAHPEVRENSELTLLLQASLTRIDTLLREAQELAESFQKGRSQLVNLAGLGLMVEILAHELNRATQHAISTLAETNLSQITPGVASRLKTLKSQLTTLQKRLRILDPLSHPGRQVKESFDLIAWVEEIVSSHDAQFHRHGIRSSVEVEPSRPKGGVIVRMVKGMIVQIMENLLSNSVYWLKQQRKLEKRFVPEIRIAIDARAREIRVSDNGPGIPVERKDEIFQPFVTTKPPGEGKGLGLYISSEIAKYHDATLILSDKPTIHPDRLNTFVLILGARQE